MGDPKHSEEWWQGVGKALIYFVFICIGVAVSVAMEVQQIIVSRKKIFIRMFFGVCAGAMASFVCYGFGWHVGYSSIIIPCSTILGQNFFNWLVSGGWDIIKSWLPDLLKKKKDKE
jgi:hypothetical protein